MIKVPDGYLACDIPCPKCGSDWAFDYRKRGTQMAAYCVSCGNYVKFVAKEDSKKQLSEWKKKVKERDGYTCQRCGELLNTTKLDSHHKMPVWFMPELRYDLDNGITLCKKCHHALHGAGGSIKEMEENNHAET